MRAEILTPAEKRVAALAVQGKTNKQIAGILCVTVKAVEWHMSSALRKTGTTRRGELADALMRPIPKPRLLGDDVEREPFIEDRALYERVVDLEHQVALLTRLIEGLTFTKIEVAS